MGVALLFEFFELLAHAEFGRIILDGLQELHSEAFFGLSFLEFKTVMLGLFSRQPQAASMVFITNTQR